MSRPHAARTAVVAVATAAALALLPPAPAAAGHLPPRVAIVLLPGLDWPELRAALARGELPHLQRLAREGAMGLMNTVTGGRSWPADAYVSLGTGAHAAGGPAGGEAYERSEEVAGWPAADLYRLRTGREPPPGAVLHLGLAALRRAAAELPYDVEVGALGEALRRAAIPAAVVGNADVFSAAPGPAGPAGAGVGPGRWVATVVMDGAGAVPAGAVGAGTLRADRSFPGGRRTDERALAAAAVRLLARGGVLAVETGDLWRLQAEEGRLSPAAYARARRAALARADVLVGHLLDALDAERDALFVLSPLPSEGARQRGALLTPVLAWGAGIRPGLLVSGTTRRPGLVANLDLAPSVLAVYGLAAPPSMYGRAWRAVPSRAPVQAVDDLYGRTLGNHLRRQPLIKAYIGAEIAVLSTGLAALALRLPGRDRLRPLLLGATAIPLAYLLLGLLPPMPVWASLLVSGMVAAALAGSVSPTGRRDALAPFALVSAGTALAVALDGLTGSRLMENSPLGHSLIGGARFYGIGNEYMGVLVGSSVLAGGFWLGDGRRRARLLAAGAAWGALLALLAWPGAGANFGGALAASVAYAVTLIRLYRLRLAARHLAAAVVLGLTVALAAAVADAARPVALQSHAARAVAALRAKDWEALRDLAARKAEMNLKLMRWTRWSSVFLVSLGLYASLALRPPAALAASFARRPGLAAACAGAAVGSVAALLANDSGIVAAATCLAYPGAALLALVLSGSPARESGAPRES